MQKFLKSVNGVQEAKNHILKYGTMHTDSIITNNSKTAEIFLNGLIVQLLCTMFQLNLLMVVNLDLEERLEFQQINCHQEDQLELIN